MLDEAERCLIRQRGQRQGEERKDGEDDESDGLIWRRNLDGTDPEPAAQSQGALGIVGSQESDSDSMNGSQGRGNPGKPVRKAVNHKRVSDKTGGAHGDGSAEIFTA